MYDNHCGFLSATTVWVHICLLYVNLLTYQNSIEMKYIKEIWRSGYDWTLTDVILISILVLLGL